MAKCYYSGEDYEGAISFIESIRKYFSAKKVIIHDLNWYAGLSYLKMGFSKSALWYFEQDTSLMKSRLLQGIAQLYIYDWAAAYGSFSNSNEDQDQGISDISNELMFIAQKGSQLKLKKPLIAGIFSAIIPGAGYAYAGSYQTALSSLLINTLLLGSSYELHKNGLRFTGATAFVIAFGWYVGNIYGSATTASRYNDSKRKKFVDESLREYQSLMK